MYQNLQPLADALSNALKAIEALNKPQAPVIPGKPKRLKRAIPAIKHQTLAEAPPAPVQPKLAVLRGGLIVVVFPDGKDGYLRFSAKHPWFKDVFGFSGKTKEWRASEKWVRANKPEALAAVGL